MDDRQAIERVCERYLHERGESVTPLGGGSFGRAYGVRGKQNCVVKFCLKAGMHRKQARETALLAKHCPIHMPETLFLHDADEEIPFDIIGMEYIAGVPAASVYPYFRSRARRRALAERVADALGAIHAATGDKYGLIDAAIYPTWNDYYKPFSQAIIEWMRANAADPKHKIPRRTAEAMEAAWAAFDRVFAEPADKPRLIHADLNVCNLMIDRKTLEPTAIIDPFDSRWADKDFDLHELYNLTGDGFYLYETYKKRIGADETCDLKCAFYALFHEIYCYMRSGVEFSFIYPKMTKNLEKQLRRFLGKGAF